MNQNGSGTEDDVERVGPREEQLPWGQWGGGAFTFGRGPGFMEEAAFCGGPWGMGQLNR